MQMGSQKSKQFHRTAHRDKKTSLKKKKKKEKENLPK